MDNGKPSPQIVPPNSQAKYVELCTSVVNQTSTRMNHFRYIYLEQLKVTRECLRGSLQKFQGSIDLMLTEGQEDSRVQKFIDGIGNSEL